MVPIFRCLLISTLFLVLGGSLQAQSLSRSGFPAAQESKPQLKRLPCDGVSIFEEDFNQGSNLPAGFTSLDLDGGTPKSNIQFLTPQGGWQVIPDLKDSTGGNLSLASPSWYESDTLASNDWLILPQFTQLAANTCFSFLAYSQDALFGESFEVRISTTGNATADFLANDPLLSVSDLGSDFSFQSIDLGAYGGQDVYIAIRHTSLNRFILVLDDLKFSSVERRDLALQSVDTMSLTLPGDTLLIQGSLVNRGLDTLVFDSAELTLAYRVDNGPFFRDLVDTAFTLLPNEVFDFTHVRPFVAPGFGLFYIEVTFNEIEGDENPANDTLLIRIPVGTVLNISDEAGPSWRLTPNPTPGILQVQWENLAPQDLTVLLTDVQGKRFELPLTQRSANQFTVDLTSFSPGIYFLVASNSEGILFSEKIIKQ